MKAFITTTSLPIFVNEGSCSFFSASCGLRQGDPPSPFTLHHSHERFECYAYNGQRM